jgi:hypothetical protein
MDEVNLTKAHQTQLKSFYSTYPLTARPQDMHCVEHQHLTIKNNIIPTSYINIDNNNNNSSSSSSSSSSNSSSNNNNNNNNNNYNHLQQYLAYLSSGARLNDGTINMQVDTIVAAQPGRKNAIPWFGKVIQLIGSEEVKVMWLHRKENTAKYYYMDDEINTIHIEAIICNEVEIEPVFGDRLLWKLLTPLPFIQALNQDNPPILAPPLAAMKFMRKVRSFDITNMVFNDVEEFKDFLYSTK